MIRLFNQYFPIRKILFFAGECGFITLAVILGLIVHGEYQHYAINLPVLFLKIVLIIIVYQVSLFFSDFYSFGATWSYRKLIYRLFISLIIAFFFLLFIYNLDGERHFTNRVLTTIFLITLILLLPWRIFYNWLIRVDRYKKQVLILGSGKLARDIAYELLKDRELSMFLQGFISSDARLKGQSIVNPKVLGITSELSGIVKEQKINKIIVAMEERRGTIPLDDLLACKANGISIEDGVSFFEKITNKLLVEYINPSDLIFCDGFKLSYLSMFVKRCFDIFLAAVGLVVSSPFFILVSLLIKLESKGPIIFKQERVGIDSKPFNICKFRSMHHDAEKKTGPTMTFDNDYRITMIGRIIRKTRLDELPQLWNILKGDMSFVGPRPDVSEYTGRLSAPG